MKKIVIDASGDYVWIFSRLKGLRGRVSLALASVVLAGSAMSAVPMFMRMLIDSALPSNNGRMVMVSVVVIGVCYCAAALFESSGLLISFSVSQQCTRDLRTALLAQMNRLSIDYHENTPTGEKLALLGHDIEEVATLGSDIAIQSVRVVLFLVLNLVMMARLNRSMTIAVLPLMPLFALLQLRFNIRLKKLADKARDAFGSANSVTDEHLSAVPQIQYLGAGSIMEQRVNDSCDVALRAWWVQRKTQLGSGLSSTIVVAAAIVFVLLLGGSRVLAGTLTVGALVAFYAYVAQMFSPVSNAMALYTRLQSTGASIHRIRALLALVPSVADEGEKNAGLMTHGFDLEGIDFSYQKRLILDQLHLHIRAGEKVAVVGLSGSGKSTLVRLLVRATDPTSGQLRLDGYQLADYTLASLRSTVCYTPQQPILFAGTLRDNLLCADPAAQDAELLDALHAAEFDAVLDRLPCRLDSSLGPGAFRLSGGEKQRVAIARALLRKAPVLILDEATSNLDAPAERSVLRNIAGFRRGQTLIIISHRISALTWVDRFVVLDKGSIVESGSHEKLYAQSGIYRSLFDTSVQEFVIGSHDELEGLPL